MAGRLAHAPLAAHGSGTASRQPSLSRGREGGGGGEPRKGARALLHGSYAYMGVCVVCVSAHLYLYGLAFYVRKRAQLYFHRRV